MPAEIVLSAPAWAKELACAYALQRLHGKIKDDEVVEPGQDLSLWMITSLSLYPEERLGARAWINNGVNHADIAEIYGGSSKKMKAGLKAVNAKYGWHSHALDKELIYFPTIALDSWINAYRPPEVSESSRPNIAIKGFADFIPNEVWAGAYPIPANIRVNADLFKDLLVQGVTRFIDLTNPNDFDGRLSYQKILLEVAEEMDRKIKVNSCPLPFRTSPTQSQVHQILKQITQALKAGERIYIHAGHNLEGRTPLIRSPLSAAQQ